VAAWRNQRIDAASVLTFEQSIALILNDLPRRRRDEFSLSLAGIWYRNSVDDGDFNNDGHADADDVRIITDETLDLIAAIDRGDLLPAIEDREVPGSKYGLAEYMEELNGLRFDDVLKLAEQPEINALLAPVEQSLRCRSGAPVAGTMSASRVRAKKCNPTRTQRDVRR
jgi:hypothetical protein